LISVRRERQITALMVVAYVVLALAFSLGPIFEGPDEIEHYRYIRWLIEHRTLPDPYSQIRSQYHHPPLFYVLAAPLGSLSDDPDFEQIDGRLNPFYPYQFGVPGNDNKNLYLHRRTESFPYNESGTARAVHLIRLLSVALGICTVLTSRAIFKIVFPDRADRRLVALAIVCFTPQFLYLSGTINLDNLLFLLTTLTLWLLLRQLRDGPSRRLAVLLGIVLGAALLTKVNAGFLVFPVGLAFLIDRRAWRYAPLTLIIVVVLAGWWYARNIMLYGDPTAVRVLLETWKTETIQPGAVALDVGITRLPYAYQTAWARFGQGAVAVGLPVYQFFDLLTLAVLVGLGIRVVRLFSSLSKSSSLPAETGLGGEVKRVLVLTVFWLGWIVALVYYSSTAWSGNQGRYLLPGIAAWGALVAFGLDLWTPQRIGVPVALSSVLILAVVAAICAFRYFLPSYSVSPAPSDDQIARPLSLRFGSVAELVGMSPANPQGRPGDLIRITLYWRALRSADSDLLSYLHSADSPVVKRDSYPGTGNLLATDWQPGERWAESYLVAIPPDAPIQSTFPLLAGLYDPKLGQALPVTAGGSGQAVIGRIAINGPTQADKPSYRFGGGIGLTNPQLRRKGDQIEVCLRWLSLASVSQDYSLFVHILTASSSQPIAQADFQPKNGRYPTSVWAPGEAIDECRIISAPGLPSSGWHVAVGLYTIADNQRLAVQDESGNQLTNAVVIITP
jgi:4-amino-4-deoxy-L-arabinose transferase-like glycosyltransferase